MDETTLKRKINAAERQKLWREKHKNVTDYLEIRKIQNKMYCDKVKKESSESAKALPREKAKLRNPVAENYYAFCDKPH